MEHDSNREESQILWLDRGTITLAERGKDEDEEDLAYIVYTDMQDHRYRIRKITPLRHRDLHKQGPFA